MAKFTHLHVHSEFSLLDGLPKIPKLIGKVKELGMDALALTDHGVMYGALRFYNECKAQGIKPIIGCEIYLTEKERWEKEEKGKGPYHLVLLAKDFSGYQNLMKLVTLSHLEGFYYKPRTDRELLKEFREGLICLSGCGSSPIAKAMEENKQDKANFWVSALLEIFGKENFYLEVQRREFEKFLSAHQSGSQIYNRLREQAQNAKKTFDFLLKMAKEKGIQLVATNDVHYVDPEDAQAQDILLCIQTGKVLSDINRMRMIDSPTYYLKSIQEMEELFADIPQALENTGKVADMCNLEIPLSKFQFPEFKIPQGEELNLYLEEKCWQGIKEKIPIITEEVKQRLGWELSVIKKKNYASYFLVVADVCGWARQNGIISTTRGSAAGSLVSFALGITTINPLQFKLPFERFLNPYRPSLPDIDIDFADDRRDEVIEYVKKKYGEDRVAQIGTFGTMMARAAVRDVARVLGWPYTKADRIAKLIPFGSQGFPMTIEQAKKISPSLREFYSQDKEVRVLLDLAQKIEGNARHASVHAAGIVIAPQALSSYTPLQKETNGEKIITQYDMYSIEDAGLVKIDFLGIRNLSILQKAVQIVKESQGKEVDLEKIPFDDEKAFALLTQGETMGLFQLGGAGMTRYLKELKPTNIFDIMAMISLFRPGPMNSIPQFIECKHNPEKIKYFDSRMEDYLKESYGVIVYQDDVLLTAIRIAGYNWEEADKFRKAIGKKIPSEMAKQKDKFISGCIKNGLSKKKGEELFAIIEPFSAYGFNKSHAASYAVIAYQTAYMKAHYPVEFMTAVMTREAEDSEKIAAAVGECSKLKIAVLPPDINNSQIGFAIEDHQGARATRFGLSAIKNVGQAAIAEILRVRDQGGEFTSISDFCQRVNLRLVNRKTLESLIKAGTMDRFGKRGQLLSALAQVKNGAKEWVRKQSQGQTSLFPDFEDQNNNHLDSKQDETEDASKEEQLSWEKQLLGFYLTENPLKKALPKLADLVSLKIEEILALGVGAQGQKVLVGGIVTGVRRTFTKAGNSEMAFARLADETGALELVIFPKIYERTRNRWLPDAILLVLGRVDLREEQCYLLVEDVCGIEEAERLARFAVGLTKEPQVIQAIQIALPFEYEELLIDKIYKILLSNPGPLKTSLVLTSENGPTKILPLSLRTELSPTLVESLKDLGCQITTF
jgi:DNA polymerase-3 subunit alpha